MSKYKLLAIDMDRTLLNSAGELSEINRRALEKASCLGLIIVPATGRARSAITNEIVEAEYVRYMISSNGAVIYDKAQNQCIYRKCISREGIDSIWDYLKDTSFMKEYFFEGRPYTEQRYYDDMLKYGVTEIFLKLYINARTPITDFETFLADKKDQIEGINFIFSDNDLRLSIWEQLNQNPNLEATTSLDFNLEIGACGMSKGTALEYLCEQLDIKSDEVIAFGDNDNDISMIRFAGVGVAVENATENVKAVADYMTLTNDQDGVANMLTQVLEI